MSHATPQGLLPAPPRAVPGCLTPETTGCQHVRVPLEDIPTKPLVRGFAAGAVIFFVIVLLVALAFGADPLVAFLAALFAGLVAGGATGFIVAGKGVSR